MKKKIISIDDDKLVLLSIQMMLSNDYEVLTFQNEQEAIMSFKENEIELVILDIRMNKINGMDIAKELRKIKSDIKIVMLSTFIENDVMKYVIKEKINGYLLKTKPEKILTSIECILSGQFVYDDTIILETEVKGNPKFEKILLNNEIKILELVAKGYNNNEIATTLGYTSGTVRNYISNILEKLGLRDRTQLVVYFYTGNIY